MFVPQLTNEQQPQFRSEAGRNLHPGQPNHVHASSSSVFVVMSPRHSCFAQAAPPAYQDVLADAGDTLFASASFRPPEPDSHLQSPKWGIRFESKCVSHMSAESGHQSTILCRHDSKASMRANTARCVIKTEMTARPTNLYLCIRAVAGRLPIPGLLHPLCASQSQNPPNK